MIKELQSLALDIRMLGADNTEVQIRDDDLDINEQEKARELGMELPEVAFSAGGNVGKAFGHQVENDDYNAPDEEDEEDSDLDEDDLG